MGEPLRKIVCVCWLVWLHDTLVQYAAFHSDLSYGREERFNSIPITLVWDGASTLPSFEVRVASVFVRSMGPRVLLMIHRTQSIHALREPTIVPLPRHHQTFSALQQAHNFPLMPIRNTGEARAGTEGWLTTTP